MREEGRVTGSPNTIVQLSNPCRGHGHLVHGFCLCRNPCGCHRRTQLRERRHSQRRSHGCTRDESCLRVQLQAALGGRAKSGKDMTPTRRHTACTIIYTNRVKRVEEKNSVALTSTGLQNEPLWIGQSSKAQPNPQGPSGGAMA